MSSPPPQEFGCQEEEKEEKGLEEEQDPEARGEDPQPEGDPPSGVIPRQRKRRRLDMKKVAQSKIVDLPSLPSNPLLEAPFVK